MVILPTPTTIKVIGFIPWIHHTRVKKAAASHNEDTWKAVQDPQNLKGWFQKQRLSPMKGAEPCSSHSRSRVVNTPQKPKDSTALLQLHSSSWLVNMW